MFKCLPLINTISEHNYFKTFYCFCISFFIVISFGVVSEVNAQGVSISPNNTPPDPSAIFDVSSIDKGALIPRMTSAQRDSIVNPAQGLVIFNTTTSCFNYYRGLGWFELCGVCIPPAQPTVSSNSPTCAGSFINLSAISNAGATYSWTGPNGFTSTIQNPAITNLTTANSGTYSVTALLNNCTSAAGSISVTVNSVPATPGSINGPQNGIANQTAVTYSISAVASATSYTWTVPSSGATITGGQGTTSITVDFGASCTGDITVTASNDCGTSATATLSVTTISPSSCLAIKQSNPSATDGIYTIDRGSGPMQCYCDMTRDGGGWTLLFQRRANANNTESCGANLNEFIHNPCGSVSNLGYTDSYSMDVDLAPGAAKYLFVQYDASMNADVDDAFIIHYVGNIFPNNSDGRYDFTVNQICNINDQNCYSSGVSWYYVVNGYLSNDYCSSSYGNGGWGGIYGYCHPNYITSNSLFGNRTVAYTETKLWGHNDDASSWMERVFVKENCIPPATPSASNNSPLCSGGTLNLFASTVSGATYTWTGPNGFTSNDQSPTIVNVTPANGGTYSVTATVNGCPSPASTTIAIIGAPSTPGPISGPTGGVGNQTGLVYSISSVANATSYSWIVPSGATITGGQGTTSITVDFGANGGDIIVTASNSCGASGPSTLTVTTTFQSCAQIKLANPSANDGIYTINPGSGSIQCYCDMTTAGGGWTLILQRRGNSSNTESCGADLNDFIHNTCGSISSLGYTDSYSMDIDNAPSRSEYLFVQRNSSMTVDADDAFIVGYMGDLFPNYPAGLYIFSVNKVCDINNQNCQTSNMSWIYAVQGWFSNGYCSGGYSSGGLLGNYGYCDGISDPVNSVFGNRSAYAEAKLWGYSTGSEYMERVFVK